MEEILYSTTDVVKKTGIPESNVRRYLTQFTVFILHKKFGKKVKYLPEGVNTLERIYMYYQDGKSQLEIEEILSKDTPKIIETEDKKPPAHQSTTTPNDMISQVIQTQNQLLQRNTEAMEKIADALEKIAEQNNNFKRIENLLIESNKKNNNPLADWWRKVINKA